MNSAREFVKFEKISRLKRECVITEKIDGTNAAIVVHEGEIWAQSRTRIITPQDDNFGFARWVDANGERLIVELGEGVHFGEWWGQGIQRRYGLNEKRFSLFNVGRWHGTSADDWRCIEAPSCFVVPTLSVNIFDTETINGVMRNLGINGSYAAPGFKRPEGIVVFHSQNSALYKMTFENDAAGKGEN